MKTVAYRDAWGFLDEYRGREFEGRWPNVSQMFHITAMRFPDNLCFHAFDPELKLTYTEAERAICRVARALAADGFVRGDKIGVSGHNSAEWVIAYFAVLRAGCIIVPLDSTLKDHEMEHFLSFGGVKAVFLDSDRVAGVDRDGRLGIRKYDISRDVMTMDGPETDFPVCSGSDVAAILFTSGTTGTPKGVMLTHDNLVSDCYLTQANIDIRSTDVIYAILPLHHAYTMMAVIYMATSTGGAVVFGKKLAMTHIFRELREGHVTMFMAVPMLYNKMISALMGGVRKKGIVVYGIIRALMKISGFLKHVTGRNVGKAIFGFLLEKLSFENIRVCISGGGPLPASTFRMFNELGIDFVQGYGLTETSPITHLNPTEAYIETSVGRKIPGCEVKIVDPDSDGNGTIFIKGPMVMQGYYNNREATEEVLSSDGWLNTGDVGHQDENGYLYLTGRAKSVIVTEGGKNVFPEEIEDHFQLYDDIDQVCVIGYLIDKAMKSEGIRVLIYPSKSYSDSVKGDKAAIEKHMNGIVEAVNKELQSYKKITKVTVVDKPMPMTSTKKIKRFEVRREYDDIV